MYKISWSCIGRLEVIPPSVWNIKKYGAKAKDGIVDIITKNGNITNLTAMERSNLTIEAAMPKNRFYNRVQLKKEDGSTFDKIIMRPPNGGESTASIPPKAKAAFLIDKKLYDEKTILTVPAAILAAITGEYSVEGNKLWPNLQEYTAIFTFTTNGPKSKLSDDEYRKVSKVDTLKFDASKFAIKQNAALDELLRLFPGLNIDKDGSVFINGKAVTKISINGKP